MTPRTRSQGEDPEMARACTVTKLITRWLTWGFGDFT
jgi:hypothetical protein